MLQPTFHKPVPMNTIVKIPRYYHGENRDILGIVVGVSSCHIIFTYIIYLYEPLQTYFGQVQAVVVNGSELESPDGKTNWRLDV